MQCFAHGIVIACLTIPFNAGIQWFVFNRETYFLPLVVYWSDNFVLSVKVNFEFEASREDQFILLDRISLLRDPAPTDPPRTTQESSTTSLISTTILTSTTPSIPIPTTSSSSVPASTEPLTSTEQSTSTESSTGNFFHQGFSILHYIVFIRIIVTCIP